MSAYLFVYEFIAHALLDYVLAQCVPNGNVVDKGPFHRRLQIIKNSAIFPLLTGQLHYF